MTAPGICPTCKRALPDGAFMCPRCELIVDGAQVERAPLPPKEPSLVFALLAPADSKLEKPHGPPPLPRAAMDDEVVEVEDRPTQRFKLAHRATAIPTVIGQLDLERCPLTTFEAYLVSLVDGATDVETLGAAVGLQTVEIQSVLHSLVQRKVLRFGPPSSNVREPARLEDGDDTTERNTQPIPREARAGAPDRQAALQEAIGLEKRGDFKGAIRVLAQAIEQCDRPAGLYNRLALVVIKERRDFKMAESLLRKAVELEPGREVYLKNLQFAARLARARGGA